MKKYMNPVKSKKMNLGGSIMNPYKMAKGGSVFKTCPGCPTPGKCKAAGKCLLHRSHSKKAKK